MRLVSLPPLGCLILAFAIVRLPAATPTQLHVSPSGDDVAAGTIDHPFRSLERARDEIRSLRQRNSLPAGVEVLVHGGEYAVRRGFQLTPGDSGTSEAPVVYRAADAEAPRFNGGVRLRNFQRVEDPAILTRLPETARNQVWEVALSADDATRLIPFELGGFSSGRGFHTHPALELYQDEEPMTLARWPNEGFVKTGDALGALTLPAWDRKPGSVEGRFRFENDRASRWVNESDAWLYGYWFWDWADSYEKVERIELGKHEITLAKPWHTYGYRKDQRFYAVNVLAELDAPGEWYLDRPSKRVLFYPRVPGDPAKTVVELSLTPFPLLDLQGVSHVSFQGLLWEGGAADGVRIEGGENCRLEGCTVRKMAGNGIEIRGGHGHQLRSCDLHTLGRGGITLAGGDRRTLTPSGHLVENCHLHHLSRIDHTYTPGVHADGVGHVIRQNLIHHVASSAMRIEGNDHLIELNEVHRVVLESDDQGAVDMFGNPTYRGNVYRHNYWHHLGNWDRKGDDAHTQRAGIRLDDAICGTVIQGNIFQRCSTGKTHFGGVQIHGGKENLVEGNLFVDTGAGVSFTPWGEKRWREFVAKALESPAVDRELYPKRYPALARLAEDHDTNVVRNNVTLRCGPMFLRAPSALQASNNQELPQGTVLPEGPDGRLVWSALDAAKLGLGDIPFDQIGLREDPWRLGRGTESVLRIGARP